MRKDGQKVDSQQELENKAPRRGVEPTGPVVGQKIPVTLPDEITRGEVVEVHSESELVVGLTLVTPMARTHTYRLGDRVLCRKQADPFGGGSHWKAVKTVE